MIDITGAAGTIYLGVQRHAKVIEVATQDEWIVRGSRSKHFHELYNSIVAVPPLSQGVEEISSFGDMEMISTGTLSQHQKLGSSSD